MKLFNLILVMLLSVAMLTGCGGGGGGGGNPVGATYSEQLQADYPQIYSSYVSMQSALESNSTGIDQRMSEFMGYFANPYYDLNNVSNRNELETTTKSRLERYNVVGWSLVPFNHKVEGEKVLVDTKMVITVELKPGVTSGSPGTYNFGDTTKGEPSVVFTWVKVGDSWKIERGLPYKQSEMF